MSDRRTALRRERVRRYRRREATPTIESIVRATLAESIGLQLDTVLLGAAAGDASQPAGLRAGISATTASALTIDTEAMHDDLGTLIGAVAAVAGNLPIVIVASPKQAAAIRLRAPNIPYEVLASGSLAAGVVVAIATSALASAVSPEPRIEVSFETVVHTADPASAIGTSGTPSVVAAPALSLFQSDLIGLKLRLEVGWALRNATGLAWSTSVLW